ncbi:hypothetical protein PBY51_017695 [Eleginops maclovinus]|uniref:PDZ domain-containing protein n=1 Tax=Eleginops maclovinus TaxID=56733 RepID=A0AAN8APD5_ELEMC|nr:hypothetical protein PBY51_017695 [Eleginops maclovinus]
MDLSMLPTQVSDYDKQRTGTCFTVRSASSPSYCLTRRPGVRKTRSFQEQEKESFVDGRDGTLSGTNGTNQEDDRTVTAYQARTGSRSAVRGQGEEKEPSDHKRTIKLNQNGTSDQTTTEFGTDRSRNCDPSSESRGRTDLRRHNMQSRMAAKSPERHSRLLPHPLASSSHSDLPSLISPDNKAHPNGKKQFLDMEAWVSGLSPKIKVWNDDEDGYEDDDESTQRDEDSNYDSDSGESSVTVTSSMSQSDHKSFCVSLSDLCNFAGVDYESENDSDEWQSSSRRTTSLSSDMSALSCVSVMPSEELDRLLEDVRSVGDSTLQDYDDVQVVVLHKDMGVGLGFSLAGGVDQNKPVTVHKVFHSGVAAQEGSIREGDQVLSINGTALSGYAHWEALRANQNSGTNTDSLTETGQLVCVRLEKNSRDLGFSLEGGADSNLENRPLTVQKIFQGGPVDKMYPGDEVEEIEGVSVVGMRRLEAWTLIRKLPPGPVDVVLRRPLKNLQT